MNKKIITIIIVTLLIFLGYFFFAPGNSQGFLAAYNIYDTASTVEEAVAHAPGAGTNVPRQKLNGILSQVLTSEMASEERQKLCEDGLVSAGELRAQIDVIGIDEKQTETALENLRKASKKSGGFVTSRKAGSIVALAEERSRTIKDIEEISYGINTRIENILRGIITDRGALTSERISALNSDLPEAEKEFDRLTAEYGNLDRIEKQIDQSVIAFQ